ncbi:MAG: AMP-binding protein [Lentimicrobiaceae bacterium]|nr:AMP-binding protein [Lentimicrobiaceae bacterium]
MQQIKPWLKKGYGRVIPEIETATSDEIRRFQEKLLRQQLDYLQQYSTFYRQVFKQNKINIKSIRSFSDIEQLPVTTKHDLQQYNNNFICVPQSKIIDYVTTSGTLGDPVTFVLTDNDLHRLAYNEHISFVCAGGSENDIYQLITTIDRRFMAGLAYFIGVRRMGAGIVRVGSGMPELQWDSINRIKPTSFITVPSFILKIIDYAEKNGIDYRNSSIRQAVCIGEPLQNPDFSLSKLGTRIKEKWDIELFTTYASTEMSSAFTDCSQHRGGHHHPELIITEFLDENNKPIQEGEAGEVTITTLGVEGMPLLRFKTGDICSHETAPCACGRTTMRLGPIIGRKKQMIKYKGTTLYPPALYDILDNIEGVVNYVVEVSTNTIGTDEILIRCGVNSLSADFEKTVKDHFRAKLRVAPSIKIESAETLAKTLFNDMNRKPVKFVDKRQDSLPD